MEHHSVCQSEITVCQYLKILGELLEGAGIMSDAILMNLY